MGQVLDILQSLCDLGNTVVIVTGRDKQTMENWFHSIPGLALAAEFGFYYRPPHQRVIYMFLSLSPSLFTTHHIHNPI